MDEIQCEILEDGTISMTTSEISETNHVSADELLSLIDEMAGGSVDRKPREHSFWKNRTVLLHGKIKKVGA